MINKVSLSKEDLKFLMNLLHEVEEEANTGEMLISQTLDLWDSGEREGLANDLLT
jgi:hypothetical protein